MEQRMAAVEKFISEQGRWNSEMRAEILGLKESMLDLKEIKEMLQDIKKGDRMSEGGEKSVRRDTKFLKESLLDLKEIKELRRDIKKRDRMSEGGEKYVNDEEKKTQDVGEGSDMKNHTLCSKEKTNNEVRFARETEMIRAEGDASIKKVKTMCCNDLFLDRPIIELTSKKVEGGGATKHHFFPNSDLLHMHKKSLWDQDLIMKVARTSMTSESWNFNLLVQRLLYKTPTHSHHHLSLQT